MRRSLALGILFALGTASTVQADEAGFKAYGFIDTRLNAMWYSDAQFMRKMGIVTPNTQLYLDHANTYFDWKPNQNVRVLTEVSLNRDAYQKTTPGIRGGIDSVSVYNSIYSQIGASTQAKMLQYLQTTPYATLPTAVLQHIADSLTRDTLSKTVHGIGQVVRAKTPAANSTKYAKDHGISLLRAQADLLLYDELNIRVGRFVTPSGIWNVDHGSPTIMTVRQPYETSFMPIFPESQLGVQLFGKTVAADQDLSYAAWVSTGRGGADALEKFDYGQDPQNPDDWTVGSHLQADLLLLDGIRLGGTVQTGTIRETQEWMVVPVTSVNLATKATTTDLAGTSILEVESSYVREWCYGLDTKIEWNKFLLQGEWNHRKVLNLQNGEKATDINAWYLLISRTFPITKNVDLTPYFMHETIGWTDLQNNPAVGYTDLPVKSFSTYVGGLNIGLFSSVRLKVEASHVVLDPVNFSSGSTANTYSSSDLDIEEFDAQFSVAF